MTVGIQELERQLRELGYSTEKPKPDMVAFQFEIPHGRFRGREIKIALKAPQFPRVPPHGPYIKPHLFPAKSGGVHPTGGIHNQGIPTGEWQLWSRPFTDWNNSDKSARTYLAFIRRLFDFT